MHKINRLNNWISFLGTFFIWWGSTLLLQKHKWQVKYIIACTSTLQGLIPSYPSSSTVLSLTAFVSKPPAPHHVSSLSRGVSRSNTAALKGCDSWVKKWAKGTANSQELRWWWFFAAYLQIAWIDSPNSLLKILLKTYGIPFHLMQVVVNWLNLI